jgi:hypothetical protein
MIGGKGKVESNKDMCNFSFIIEVLMSMCFLDAPKKQPQPIITSKVHKQLAIKP